MRPKAKTAATDFIVMVVSVEMSCLERVIGKVKKDEKNRCEVM